MSTVIPTADLETLVAGATVVVTRRDGEIEPLGYQGIFHRDIRLISRLRLEVDGHPPALIATRRDGADVAHQAFGVAADELGNPTMVLTRVRRVAADVVDQLELRLLEGRARTVEVRLTLETDLVPLLDLKYHRGPPPAPVAWSPMAPRATRGGTRVEVTTEGEPTWDGGSLVWAAHVTAEQPWSVGVHYGVADASYTPPPTSSAPAPLTVSGSEGRWQPAIAAAVADLAALRTTVPDLGFTYIAAGAPWFMALFGRDALLAAWQSLPLGTGPAVDVLATLAHYQGRDEDARTLEQPGRILHELRFGGSQVFGLDPGRAYYGTVDASPLFVVTLGEAARWGAHPDAIRELLSAARAAMTWCADYGDLDGDGFVEYEPDPDGLVNQGWKDSGDAMVHADGSQAPGPIALAEVQAYAYAAALALAELERRFGDPTAAPRWESWAADLRDRFHAAFWLDGPDLVAMALDGDKRPLAVASSVLGHCLWAGILDHDIAVRAARRLTRPDLLTRWGIRTLGAAERAYQPMVYHRGTVWPHDSAICAAGLARVGAADAVRHLVAGMLDLAEHYDWRLPELVGGIDGEHPVPYPVACRPQAWAAGTPLLMLRSLLRLDPDVPAGVVRLAPLVAPGADLRVAGIRLGERSLDVEVRRGEVTWSIDGAPLEVVLS